MKIFPIEKKCQHFGSTFFFQMFFRPKCFRSQIFLSIEKKLPKYFFGKTVDLDVTKKRDQNFENFNKICFT